MKQFYRHLFCIYFFKEKLKTLKLKDKFIL